MELVFHIPSERVGKTLIKRPKIPIKLSHGAASLRCVGLVDSGSDVVYLPFEIAMALGIKLGEKRETIKGLGEMEVVKTELDITVGEEMLNGVEAYVGTHPVEAADVVLGTPLFERFDIELKYREERLILK